jgi:drug/metabolite transporter (DMT)-like permease
MPVSRRIAPLYATAAAVIWGFTFLSTKVAITTLPPMTLGFARFLIAGLFLSGLFLIKHRLPRLAARDIPRMAASGLAGVTLYFLCENNGLLYLSASEASLVIATIPVVTLLADRVILKTRLGAKNYAGAALSIAGVVLIVVESLRFSSTPIGYVYMLLAALSWVVYTFITGPLFSRYDRLDITFWQSVFGMLGFIPFLFFETPSWGNFNTVVALNVLYLGIFGSAIATLCYVSGLDALGPSTANVYNNLIPVISVAASFIVLKERLTPLQLLGGAVAIGGVWLATSVWGAKKPKTAS